jgi:hypothetical protein
MDWEQAVDDVIVARSQMAMGVFRKCRNFSVPVGRPGPDVARALDFRSVQSGASSNPKSSCSRWALYLRFSIKFQPRYEKQHGSLPTGAGSHVLAFLGESARQISGHNPSQPEAIGGWSV